MTKPCFHAYCEMSNQFEQWFQIDNCSYFDIACSLAKSYSSAFNTTTIIRRKENAPILFGIFIPESAYPQYSKYCEHLEEEHERYRYPEQWQLNEQRKKEIHAEEEMQEIMNAAEQDWPDSILEYWRTVEEGWPHEDETLY